MHVGQKIKEVVEGSDLSVAEFSRRINTSRENVYSIFKRSTIDIELLARISEILNYNFFIHFIPERFLIEQKQEMEKYRTKIEVLETEKKYLKRINDLQSMLDDKEKKDGEQE